MVFRHGRHTHKSIRAASVQRSFGDVNKLDEDSRQYQPLLISIDLDESCIETSSLQSICLNRASSRPSSLK